MQFLLGEPEAFAVNASSLQKSIRLVHEDGVIDRNGELNVTGMPGARRLVQVTSGASMIKLSEPTLIHIGWHWVGTYGASPQEPSAGSYRPPGTGLRRLSKVLSFSIRLTEIDRISLGERKVNSTLSTPEETGCAIFMARMLPICRGQRIGG